MAEHDLVHVDWQEAVGRLAVVGGLEEVVGEVLEALQRGERLGAVLLELARVVGLGLPTA